MKAALGVRHVVLFVVLSLGLAVRALPLGAGLPYLSYIDEGHVLHRVMTLLRSGTWDPGWYRYPSLPIYLVAGAATAWRPAYALTHGRSLVESIPDDTMTREGIWTYDLIAPPELILAGRIVTLLFALGIVAATYALGTRVFGPAAGLCGALFAAVLPALVTRSAIVLVDPFSACFCALALLVADRLRTEEKRPARTALLAGAMSGLAFTSKYTAAAVLVAVLLAALLRGEPIARRLRHAAIACLGFGISAVITMPALVLRTKVLWQSFRQEAAFYASMPAIQGYFAWSTRKDELGPVFPLLALLGLAGLLVRRKTRAVAGTWLAFAGLFLAPLLVPKYRPFRNVLPLIPIACVGAGAVFATLVELPRRRSRLLTVAAAAAALVLSATLLRTSYAVQSMSAAVRDSRRDAVDWLARETRPGQNVLLVQELAVLPEEVARIPAKVSVLPWAYAAAESAAEKYDWVVTTALRSDTDREKSLKNSRERWEVWSQGRSPAAIFGSDAVHPALNMWRENNARVLIFRRNRTPAE